MARLWPDHLEELPRYDERNDQFVCPSCGDSLVVGDAREPAVQVITYLDGVEQFRILVEEGTNLEIGRSDAKGRIGLDRHLPEGHVKGISRRHLSLRLQGNDFTVSDLGSKNGSAIGSRTSQPDDRQQLHPGHSLRWGRRDVVFLPGGITLERSGRRLAILGEQAHQETGPSRSPSATTLASELE